MATRVIYDKPTPVFLANERAYYSGNYGIICNEGGTRSGKTYSVIKLLIEIALTTPNKRISIVSHSLPHIKRGAYRDFKIIMDNYGIWNEKRFSYTDFIYYFENGSYIELFGLEDEGKARGPGRDILFINEANLVKKLLFDQLAVRTTECIFLDWNPADYKSWVYDIADNGTRVKLIHSTYLNNLSNLTPQQISLIESYKTLQDDFMWKVYGLGLRGAAKEIIYTKWGYVDELPTNGDPFYGLDFGFTHPAAMVKVVHYEGANYVEEKIYRSGMTMPELIEEVKNAVGGNRMAPIYADAAEPKSIEDIYRNGYNIKPADKNVWPGIIKVKSYPLFITRKSVNLANELGSYKWRKDKNDNLLEEPVKTNDDLCDAMRYAIFTHLTVPSYDVAVA